MQTDSQQPSQSPKPDAARFSLRQLAEKAGITPRTLRFYIARGLVSGPGKAGRGADYGESHLKQIQQVRRFQDKGLTLSEIAHRLAAPAGDAPTLPSDAWRHYPVADDIVLMVREQAAPWRLRHIQRAMTQLRNTLNQPDNKQEESP